MFNRRTIQVSFPKNKKASEETQTETKTLIDYADTITEVGAKVVFGAVVVLASYIVLDTLRQVAVETVKNHND
jgi:hypothetical protein